jgi:hypothetical protein
MGDLWMLCLLASAIMGYVNFAFLVIIDNKLKEIKSEIKELKKEKDNA